MFVSHIIGTLLFQSQRNVFGEKEILSTVLYYGYSLFDHGPIVP